MMMMMMMIRDFNDDSDDGDRDDYGHNVALSQITVTRDFQRNSGENVNKNMILSKG